MGPPDFVSPLLLENHNLESIKVGQLSPGIPRGNLLSPARSTPLGINIGLLPVLLDGSRAGGAGDLRGDDGSQGDMGEGDGLAWGTRGLGSIYENLHCRKNSVISSDTDVQSSGGEHTRLWSMISTIAASFPA